ncbi:MAG: hypothetical protein ACLTE2_06185 [Eubacteriales bacterium]
MEQVYLAPCTEYQYEPLKQAVDDIFDHLALNRFLFQGANVVIKPNLLMKCNPDTAIITHPLLGGGCGRYESKRTLAVELPLPKVPEADIYAINGKK